MNPRNIEQVIRLLQAELRNDDMPGSVAELHLVACAVSNLQRALKLRRANGQGRAGSRESRAPDH